MGTRYVTWSGMTGSLSSDSNRRPAHHKTGQWIHGESRHVSVPSQAVLLGKPPSKCVGIRWDCAGRARTQLWDRVRTPRIPSDR